MFVIEYVPIYSIETLEMNISGVQTTVNIKLKTAEGDSVVAACPSARPYVRVQNSMNIVYKCTTSITKMFSWYHQTDISILFNISSRRKWFSCCKLYSWKYLIWLNVQCCCSGYNHDDSYKYMSCFEYDYNIYNKSPKIFFDAEFGHE